MSAGVQRGAPPPPLGGPLRLTAADLWALRARTPSAELARKVANRVRSRVRDEVTLVELRKDLDAIAPAPGTSTLAIVPIDHDRLGDLHDLNRRRCATRKTRRFAADLDRGCEGFVAYRDGVAIGYYWWAAGPAASEHRDLRAIPDSVEIRHGDVYGYDLYLLDEARTRNAAAHLLAHAEAALRDRGYARLWGYVEADNRPARWLYATRRYVPTRRITRRTLLGYRSHQVTPA